MSISDTDVNSIYKTYYGKYGVEFVGFKAARFASKLHKDKGFAGKTFHSAVEYADVANGSHTASTTIGADTVGGDVAFDVPLKKYFNRVSIEKFAFDTAKKDGALSDLFTYKMNSLIRASYNALEFGLFGSYGGYAGQVAAYTPAAASLTLTKASDARKFQKDDVIVTSESNGTSGSLQAGSFTILSSDATPGVATITATGAIDGGVASIDAEDYLFKAGSFGLAWNGLKDWVPTSTSSFATAFLGVTRSNAPIRLGGSRKSYTGESIFGAIQQMAAIIATEGGEPTDVWMNPLQFDRAVQEARASTINYQMTEMNAKSAKQNQSLNIGYQSISVSTAYGMLNINQSLACDDDLIYLLSMDKDSMLGIHTGKEMVNVDDEDGNVMLREANAFAYEIRSTSFSNLACRRPVDNGVITIDEPV